MDGCRRIDDDQFVCGGLVVGISGLCRKHQHDTCKWTEDGDNCGEKSLNGKNYCKYHLAEPLKIKMEEGEWGEFLEWLSSLSKQYKKVFKFSKKSHSKREEVEKNSTAIISAKSLGFIGTFSHDSKPWSIEIAPKIKEVEKQAILYYQLDKSFRQEFGLVRIWSKSKELSGDDWDKAEWYYLLSKMFVSEVESLYKKGLINSNIEIERDVRSGIKGRLMVDSYIRNYLTRNPDTFPCKYQAHNINTLPNQLLYSTVNQIQRDFVKREPDLAHSARKLKLKFQGVNRTHITPTQFPTIRAMARGAYKSSALILELAMMMHLQKTPSDDGSYDNLILPYGVTERSDNCISRIIRINDIFENYVEDLIKSTVFGEKIRQATGEKSETFKVSRTIDAEIFRGGQVKPDAPRFIVDDTTIIIDSKWKNYCNSTENSIHKPTQSIRGHISLVIPEGQTICLERSDTVEDDTQTSQFSMQGAALKRGDWHQMAAYCSADNEHENWGNPKTAFLVYPDPINNAEAKPEFHGWLGIPKEEPKTGDNLSLRNPIGIISVPFRPELFIRGNDDDDKEKLIAAFHGVFVEAISKKVPS